MDELGIPKSDRTMSVLKTLEKKWERQTLEDAVRGIALARDRGALKESLGWGPTDEINLVPLNRQVAGMPTVREYAALYHKEAQHRPRSEGGPTSLAEILRSSSSASQDKYKVAHDDPKMSEVHDVCGAKKRQGDGFCSQRAGWGTDHVGQGRCKLHGGATPVKHGRYSKTTRGRLGSLIEGFRDDPTPWDATDELLAMRALFVDYLRRAGGGEVELDHEAASRILDRVSKIIDRVKRARSDSYITRPQFYRLMGEMGNVVAQNVASDDERRRIVDGWANIRLA